MKHRRVIGAFVVLSAAALGLSACGSGSKSPSSSSSSATAQATVAANPAAVAAAKPWLTKIQDAIKKSGSYYVSMTLSESGQTLSTSGQYELGATPAQNKASLTQTLAGTSLDSISVGSTLYSKKTGDTMWTSTPESSAVSDPASSFADFANSVVKFALGTDHESIDGVATTQLLFTLSTSAMGLSNPTPSPSASGSGSGSANNPSTVLYTVWVGPDNLPRKADLEPAAGASAIILFSKWGQQFSIAAPPADQVTKVSASPTPSAT